MRIAYLSAGAGAMYCGSCLNDSTLTAALGRAGHDVLLVPTYTPLRTDEDPAAAGEVFFGAINFYLRHKLPLLARLPRPLAAVLDRPRLLALAGRFAASTDPRSLGALTLAMLRAEDQGEVHRLAERLRPFRPDIVHLTNSLFLGLARPLGDALGVPVVCSLQGEDLFLDGLAAAWRSRVLDEVRARAADVAAFLAPSRDAAARMAEGLGLPAEKMHVVPLGIRIDGFASAGAEKRPGGRLAIGYLARVAPEKGLHLLAEAFVALSRDVGADQVELHAAGYLAARDRAYLDGIRRDLDRAGLAAAFRYAGELDRRAKIAFLAGLDAFCLPTTHPEAKGRPALEAMAAGVPCVLPRHGSFPELIDATGGGVLVEPGSAPAIAAALRRLRENPELRADLGRRGRQSVSSRFGDVQMAAATVEVYRAVLEARP